MFEIFAILKIDLTKTFSQFKATEINKNEKIIQPHFCSRFECQAQIGLRFQQLFRSLFEMNEIQCSTMYFAETSVLYRDIKPVKIYENSSFHGFWYNFKHICEK